MGGIPAAFRNGSAGCLARSQVIVPIIGFAVGVSGEVLAYLRLVQAVGHGGEVEVVGFEGGGQVDVQGVGAQVGVEQHSLGIVVRECLRLQGLLVENGYFAGKEVDVPVEQQAAEVVVGRHAGCGSLQMGAALEIGERCLIGQRTRSQPLV